MNQNQHFWRRIAASQDQVLSRASSVAREMSLVATIARRQARTARRRTFPLLFLAPLAVAAAAVVLFPRPLTFEVGEARAPGALGATLTALSTPLSVDFSDGSTLRLGASARGRVTQVGAHGAALLVERGHADISVVPRAGANWNVDIGPFHVAVKGTRFSLDWDPAAERLDFVLERGAVVITAACLDQPRPLVAGQSLHASCLWQPADAPPSPTGAAAAIIEPTPALGVDHGAPALALTPRPRLDERSAARATPAWRSLAASQRYADALAAAERGGFEAECRRADADDLLVLGDVARLAGSPRRALQAYTAARAKQAASDRSTFAMGVVEFDQRRDFARAAEWFATYLREQPRGPLAEQAAGRLMDAWQRAGESARARETARAYLNRYPHGAYADLARQTLR